MKFIILLPLLIAALVDVTNATQPSPKPGKRALTEYDESLHGKDGPGKNVIKNQLVAFNNLEYHAHNKFFAKTLSYNEEKLIDDGIGPFNVSFFCSDAKIVAFIGLTNDNSYPITYHGNFVSGSNSSKVHLLNQGESVKLGVAEWLDPSTSGNVVGAPSSKGAVMTSDGYFLALSNADSFIMTVSNDDTDDLMPNSDCTVAGFMEFAHPKHGNYYNGFLYEDVLLEKASNSAAPSSLALFGGVVGGVVVGAALVVVTTLLLTKNRSLLLHSVGFYDSAVGECMTDTSSAGLVSPSSSERGTI